MSTLQRTAHRCFLPSFGSFSQAVSEDACGGHVCNGSGRNEQSLQRTFHRCFLLSFRSFGQVVSEEKNFLNQPIRNKRRLWRPCSLTDRDEMSSLYRDLPQMVPTKFQFIWLRGFRDILSVIQFRDNCILNRYKMYVYLNQSYLPFNRKIDFLDINQPETRIACGGHDC